MSARAAILDTSALIAGEHGHGLDRDLPDRVAVSVVTLAELEVGVLVAPDQATRAARLATLTETRARLRGIPADEPVASAYARLAAQAIEAGHKPRIHDTWIAATAQVHDAEVWTRDADFTTFDDVRVVQC
jgi:hypothetical protein